MGLLMGKNKWDYVKGNNSLLDNSGEELRIHSTLQDHSNNLSGNPYPKFNVFFDKISIPIFIWHSYKNSYVLVYKNDHADNFQNGLVKNYLGKLLSYDDSTNYDIIIDFNDCLSNQRTIKREIKIQDHTADRLFKLLVEYKPLQKEFLLMQVLDSRPEFIFDQTNTLYSVIDNLPASVIITNRDAEILYTNNKFTEITGYSSEEVFKKNPRILKSGRKKPEQYSELWKTILSGNEWKGEFLNKKKNGELYWEFAVISPVKNAFNEITNFIAVKEEITEKKKSEEELRKSEKLAAIGKMTTYITHEIRSPLTSIKLNIDILSQKMRMNNNQSASFDIIKKEIKRLDNLLKDILQFSREKDLILVNVDIHNLIQKVITLIQPLLKKNNIKLFNNTGSHIIQGEPSRLQSLFLHLIENSIEAIKENGKIEIYSVIYQKCNEINIYIKDNGTGIKNPELVFDPFYTTKTAGTGLGLPIVRKIIEKHNGTIELFTSKKGETIFKIRFPAQKKINGKNISN